MSGGPRIPLAEADCLMADIFQRFNLDSARYFAAGSIRRRRQTVGDLEIVAPLPIDDADPLFDRLSACVQAEEGSLFKLDNAIGIAKAGFRRGFKHCRIELSHSHHGQIPFEVYRYTPGFDGNLGWSLIMRTGPGEFGKEFLARWKKKWQIPRGQEACVDNFLRDAGGNVVPTKSEVDAFQLCGFGYVIPPEKRDEYMQRLLSQR